MLLRNCSSACSEQGQICPYEHVLLRNSSSACSEHGQIQSYEPFQAVFLFSLTKDSSLSFRSTDSLSSFVRLELNSFSLMFMRSLSALRSLPKARFFSSASNYSHLRISFIHSSSFSVLLSLSRLTNFTTTSVIKTLFIALESRDRSTRKDGFEKAS